MSSDQVARLAATIEVLTNAVQFLLAERVSTQAPAVQGDLLRLLQDAFSQPTRRDETVLARAEIRPADLARWTSVVATSLIDDARRQLGRPPEGVAPAGPARSRAVSDMVSKMAEGAHRKGPHGPVAPPEDERSAA